MNQSDYRGYGPYSRRYYDRRRYGSRSYYGSIDPFDWYYGGGRYPCRCWIIVCGVVGNYTVSWLAG